MINYYDRDGNPMPDDWWDKSKHGDRNFSHWTTERRVANTAVGDIIVSTVWLGLDHAFMGATPIIFETMTFGDPWNNEMARHGTEEDAMRRHLNVLDRLRAGRPPFAYLDDENSEEN